MEFIFNKTIQDVLQVFLNKSTTFLAFMFKLKYFFTHKLLQV